MERFYGLDSILQTFKVVKFCFINSFSWCKSPKKIPKLLSYMQLRKMRLDLVIIFYSEVVKVNFFPIWTHFPYIFGFLKKISTADLKMFCRVDVMSITISDQLYYYLSFLLCDCLCLYTMAFQNLKGFISYFPFPSILPIILFCYLYFCKVSL